ncbi:hypothetical protein ABZ891_28625 [Streptomyces sp. NPDC047023]|uniref:hypothetical protein n=1 Tax=Streptomyces sp. NPDC047023 TaxID=3155139 RepID=UPI0033D2CAD5
MASIHLRLAEYGWFNVIGDLTFTLTSGEYLAVLWASVLIAVLVRLLRRGPAALQLALSAAAALSCALLSLALLAVLLQAGWWLFPVLGAAGAFVRLVTSR